jgi:hypothetical protein
VLSATVTQLVLVELLAAIGNKVPVSVGAVPAGVPQRVVFTPRTPQRREQPQPTPLPVGAVYHSP